ncbi:anthranilate phosphoribosyltransferase [soil metagenome]
MNMHTIIEKLSQGQNLNTDEMTAAMQLLMQGQATQAQIGAFLLGLRLKGETVTEIAAAVQVMRDFVTPVVINEPNLVEIVGTGGDGAQLFNVSTASALVMAAAGVKVAKHGNRAVSSRSGSADLLESAGVNINLTPLQIKQCIEQVGIGFMYGPLHHNAMQRVGGARKELGIRTVFNLLGSLSNPAATKHQVVGVYAANLLRPVAEVLAKLGSKHVLVVHAEDGLDEISNAATTQIVELKLGKISTYTITPEQFNITCGSLEALRAATINESLAIIHSVLANTAGPARDIVALNAGAGIYVSGLAESLAAGVKLALLNIANGAAKAKLAAWIELSQRISKIT